MDSPSVGMAVHFSFTLYNYGKWVPVTTAWRFLRLLMEERPPMWRVAANILKSSRGQQTRDGPAAWKLGDVLTSHCKNWPCFEMDSCASILG